MKRYLVYVDTVNRNEDWDDDSKIEVVELIVEAENSNEARQLACEIFERENTGKEFYVWEVTENDIIE